jgi:hypothetical protein
MSSEIPLMFTANHQAGFIVILFLSEVNFVLCALE